MKSLLKFFGLLMTFMLGVMLGSFTGSAVTALITGVLFVLFSLYKNTSEYLKRYTLRGLALESLDLTELATALGAYHREHRDELASEILLDEDFTQDMEVMDDVTDEVPLPDLSITDIVQPGINKDFEPIPGAMNIGARILKVRDCKVDLLLEPWRLEKTWLGKLKKANDPMDMPFEQFIFDYINSKIKENMRMQGIYRGVYDAAGNTPIDTMDGYLTIIADEILGGDIVPVVTGAITPVNVIDRVEATYDALGEAYKNGDTIMKCSPTIFAWYCRRYRLEFGGNTDYAGMPKNRRRVLIDGTNCELVAEPGFGTSQRLVATKAENFVYGVDSASGYNVDVQKFDRQLKVLIDFKAGVQFKQIHARGLAVNDQI